jgi:hypothetical protein
MPVVGSVKYQAKPSTIYSSTKTEEALLLALQRIGMAATTTSINMISYILIRMKSCR